MFIPIYYPGHTVRKVYILPKQISPSYNRQLSIIIPHHSREFHIINYEEHHQNIIYTAVWGNIVCLQGTGEFSRSPSHFIQLDFLPIIVTCLEQNDVVWTQTQNYMIWWTSRLQYTQ